MSSPDGPPPVLHLNTDVATEGEEITLTCTAPEQPSEFYFYKNSNEIKMMDVTSPQAVLKYHITTSGIHKFHCVYEVLVDRKSNRSQNSSTVTVSVKGTSVFRSLTLQRMECKSNDMVVPFVSSNYSELDIMPVLEITGPQKIYEGDQLFLACSVNGSVPGNNYVNLLLKQGTKFLREGYPKVNHSLVVLARGPADFKCELDMKRVVKTTSKIIPVAGQLFCRVFIIVKANFF